LADIGRPKQGLPRKVGGIHLVTIKPVQSADSACREIQGRGAAQATCANQKNARCPKRSDTFVIDAIK
jgi:hypothetical protein